MARRVVRARRYPCAVATDDIEQLRAELRQLWRASRSGRWRAAIVPGTCGQVHLTASSPGGSEWLLALPNRLEDARLAAAAVNALPVLFAALDRLTRGVPVLGDVVEGGRVVWRGSAPTTSG